MKNRTRFVAVVVGLLALPVLSGAAPGGAIMGKGENGYPRAVGMTSDRLKVEARAIVEVCSTYAQGVKAVGVVAVSVPTAAMSGRKLIRICNSPENVGSPKVKCLLGATAPVMGATTAGDVLSVGDCFPYQVDSTVDLKCISDVAGTAVTTFECAW